MPAIKESLSAKNVYRLPVGEYADTNEKGLMLYVSETSRIFGWYRWAGGKPVRRSLGELSSAFPFDKALAEAKRLNGLVLDGKEIPKKDQPEVGEITLKELVDTYTLKLKAEGKRQWYWAEKCFELCYQDWYARKLADISPQDIEDRQAILGRKPKVNPLPLTKEKWRLQPRGPQAAARALKALRAVYAYAIKKKLHRGDNVGKSLTLKTSAPRQRWLSADERAAFLTALDDPRFYSYVRPFFRLLLATGVRWGNLAAAKWSDVDLDKAVWTIPPEDAKMGDAIRVILNAEAVKWFGVQAGLSETWVFPSVKKAAHGHLVDPGNVFQRVLKVAGIETHTTIHDLRRSYGSVLVNAGVPITIVAKAMGHKNPATTMRHYAVVSDEAIREALARVG